MAAKGDNRGYAPLLQNKQYGWKQVHFIKFVTN